MIYTLDGNDMITDIQLGKGDEGLAEIYLEKVMGSNLVSHITGLSSAAFLRVHDHGGFGEAKEHSSKSSTRFILKLEWIDFPAIISR